MVGTDEAFFEDDDAATIRDLYTEKQGVLDDSDDEVDLAPYAWQIWKQATKTTPTWPAPWSLAARGVLAKGFALDESRFLLVRTQPKAARWCM